MLLYPVGENRSGIYRIYHKESGNEYIGSAVRFSARWRQHRWDLIRGKHHSPYLQRSYRKYGAVLFAVEVIEYVENLDDLILREQYYLDTRHPVYNVSPTAGSSRGVRLTLEQRRRLSEARKGKPLTPAQIAHFESLRGKPATEKQLAALRLGWTIPHIFTMTAARQAFYERRRGTPAHPNSLKGLELGHGRPLSPEAAAALHQASADARRGKPLSAIHRAKIGAIHKGRQYSETQLRGLRGIHEERRGQPMNEATRKRLYEAWERRRQEGRTRRTITEGEPRYLTFKVANEARILECMAELGWGTAIPQNAFYAAKILAPMIPLAVGTAHRNLKAMLYADTITIQQTSIKDIATVPQTFTRPTNLTQGTLFEDVS